MHHFNNDPNQPKSLVLAPQPALPINPQDTQASQDSHTMMSATIIPKKISTLAQPANKSQELQQRTLTTSSRTGIAQTPSKLSSVLQGTQVNMNQQPFDQSDWNTYQQPSNTLLQQQQHEWQLQQQQQQYQHQLHQQQQIQPQHHAPQHSRVTSLASAISTVKLSNALTGGFKMQQPVEPGSFAQTITIQQQQQQQQQLHQHLQQQQQQQPISQYSTAYSNGHSGLTSPVQQTTQQQKQQTQLHSANQSMSSQPMILVEDQQSHPGQYSQLQITPLSMPISGQNLQLQNNHLELNLQQQQPQNNPHHEQHQPTQSELQSNKTINDKASRIKAITDMVKKRNGSHSSSSSGGGGLAGDNSSSINPNNTSNIQSKLANLFAKKQFKQAEQPKQLTQHQEASIVDQLYHDRATDDGKSTSKRESSNRNLIQMDSSVDSDQSDTHLGARKDRSSALESHDTYPVSLQLVSLPKQQKGHHQNSPPQRQSVSNEFQNNQQRFIFSDDRQNSGQMGSSYLRVSKHYQPQNDEIKEGGETINELTLEGFGDEDALSEKSEKDQKALDEDEIKRLRAITKKKQKSGHYNPLQIPPDWEFAKMHAMSRATSLPQPQSKNMCKCCGYVIDRTPLKFSIDTQALNFLGSGYPLFYNFIIYCIFILFALFMVSGAYNLFTNYLGNYCIADEQELDSDFKKKMHMLGKAVFNNVQFMLINKNPILLFLSNKGYEFGEEEIICHKNIFHTFSLANKKDQPGFLRIQSYLNIAVTFAVMIMLMFFRRNQRQIDKEIDASLATPQDYTILVKNIPISNEYDYDAGLREIFQKHCCPGKQLKVENITLIYDITEIIHKEEELKKVIASKQEFLAFHHGFDNAAAEDLDSFDSLIKRIESEIHHLETEIPKDNMKFSGTAFVSFMNEQMKQECLKENPSSTWEQFVSWIQKGQKRSANDRDLMWGNNKLFIEEAPEPDDVDWEFIHVPTSKKLIIRIKCLFYRLLFMAISFLAISAIAKFQSHLIEEAYEERQKGEMESFKFSYIKSLSFIISAVIVLFNKFVLAEVFHRIADMEHWSTKTKLNISFAESLSMGLFLNSAVITYVVEIIKYKNYYGPGGFIYTESWVFLWNAVLPPLVWLINPYQMLKLSERKKQLQLAAKNQCYLTQEQANELMEDYNYVQGKRYADVMKTMWFTFLYAPCIPLANFFSIFNLVAYYYIDKYNILRRSTVKENLSKQVSLQMTENLEYIIIFFALGNITFQMHLFQTIDWTSVVQLILGIIYACLPMQDLNEYMFKIDDLDEEIEYSKAKLSFKTDYDLLNPITKKHALTELFKSKVQKVKKLNKLFLIKPGRPSVV